MPFLFVFSIQCCNGPNYPGSPVRQFGLEIWELIKLNADELILLLIERKKQTPP